MQIVIEGAPIGRARARVVRRGGFSIAYDPQHKEKQKTIQLIKDQLDDLTDINASNMYSVDLICYMPIPKSISKKKKLLLNGTYHNKKPDGDNIYKYFTDCLNGIVYSDDSQIVKGSFEKKYSDNPRTVININCIS